MMEAINEWFAQPITWGNFWSMWLAWGIVTMFQIGRKMTRNVLKELHEPEEETY